MDSTAFNYNALAVCDDGSCSPIVYGCMDTLAPNYNSLANVDDGSCVYGCSGPTSVSYTYLNNAGNNNTCDFVPTNDSNGSPFTYNAIAGSGNPVIVVFGDSSGTNVVGDLL